MANFEHRYRKRNFKHIERRGKNQASQKESDKNEGRISGAEVSKARPAYFSKWSREYVQRAVDDCKAITVFVEGLITQWGPLDMFKAMSRFGTVIDIFIPGRPKWNGIRYGFVRFVNVRNIVEVLARINSSLGAVGEIRANVARERRKRVASVKEFPQSSRSLNDGAVIREGRSFKEAVAHGCSASSLMKGQEEECDGTFIVFNPKQESLAFLNSCTFGVFSEDVPAGHFRSRLMIMLGRPVNVKLLGGNYVQVSFDSREEMLSCVQAEEAWNDGSLMLFREWQEGDCASNRLCYLNVSGIPPHAWCEEFFGLIVVRFGKLVKLENRMDTSDHLESRVEQQNSTKDNHDGTDVSMVPCSVNHTPVVASDRKALRSPVMDGNNTSQTPFRSSKLSRILKRLLEPMLAWSEHWHAHLLSKGFKKVVSSGVKSPSMHQIVGPSPLIWVGPNRFTIERGSSSRSRFEVGRVDGPLLVQGLTKSHANLTCGHQSDTMPSDDEAIESSPTIDKPLSRTNGGEDKSIGFSINRMLSFLEKTRANSSLRTKRRRKLNIRGSIKPLCSGDSSTQDDDIVVGNRRAIAEAEERAIPLEVERNTEAAKTLEVGRAIGLEEDRVPKEVMTYTFQSLIAEMGFNAAPAEGFPSFGL
ncbi:hypothetical protein Tsubulata_009189 [Turnera subulata]|uniref:RRM domain-containing protein n=1 Tax=Turnera subulata TaxID=218843 RepID=A0A9Q0FIG6_9ROSI|nr:hypothetical protein Tsubulata_009189 [Turnera subulata]